MSGIVAGDEMLEMSYEAFKERWKQDESSF